MTAFYNEIDPYAAQWLRNLIAAGHIAPGVVDERSIEDITPDEIRHFTQCHFFAGIGVWSLALRNAGWRDDQPIWTGSCPCQPFSAAGKGAGFADERHLWPAFHHLIRECQPPIVVGEQVASSAVDVWIDLVHADLEAVGYAFGSVPFPSAGVGAPHIRDRNYWVANTNNSGRIGRRPSQAGNGRDAAWIEPERLCDAGGMGNTDHARLEGQRGGYPAEGGRIAAAGSAATAGESGGLADADGSGRQQLARVGRSASLLASPDGEGKRIGQSGDHGASAFAGPGPTNGFWRDADWLGCRDGKWRPVEASPQPLVDGSAESLGRVRPEVITQIEKEVNAATAQTEGGRAAAMRALLEDLGAQAKCGWPAGGLPGLHEAPFLLAFVRQLQEQGWRIAEGVALPRAEATSGVLRSVWHDQALAGAPHQRGLGEQRADELADPVCVLSRILARHASAAWDDAYAAHAEIGFPIGHGSRSRVGRLRGYGNAINAEAARVWIETVMECMP